MESIVRQEIGFLFFVFLLSGCAVSEDVQEEKQSPQSVQISSHYEPVDFAYKSSSEKKEKGAKKNDYTGVKTHGEIGGVHSHSPDLASQRIFKPSPIQKSPKFLPAPVSSPF